jgi:MoxR-like ATPase
MNPKIILSPKNGPHAYYVVDASGNTVNYEIREALVKLAYEKGDLIEFDTETLKARRIANHMETGAPEPQIDNMPVTETDPVLAFIHNEAVQTKPKELIIKDLKWKYLIRSVIRGKNIMMTGPAGAGKSVTAKHVANALQREFFYFNLGATQDPRATLIGNVHFDKNSGTYFAESQFIKAIQTENSVILLDELSRAHPEAWNILMTVLDPNQRYVRLDEHQDAKTVSVAPGVCFIATANIGNEYTATRAMDRALLDRFVILEMDVLTQTEEMNLLSMLYPKLEAGSIHDLAEIAHTTRMEVNNEVPKISTAISTRLTIEMAGLMADGFDLVEAAEVCIFPFFDNSGGVDSERTFIRQLVQKYMKAVDADPFNLDQPQF